MIISVFIGNSNTLDIYFFSLEYREGFWKGSGKE
jgi:hypothetical protein